MNTQNTDHRLLGLTWIFVILLAACGDASRGPATVDFAEPTAAELATAPDAAAPLTFQELAISVQQAFWHSGFRVELGEGRLYAEQNERTGESDYFVSIAWQFENLGNRQIAFSAPVVLVAGVSSVPAGRESTLPSVPAGLSSTGELVFRVDSSFTSDAAQLIIGSTDVVKAQIPLEPDGGPLDTLAPSRPSVSGSLSMKLLDLRLTSAELRADRLENYSQVEDGKLALTLSFDATSRKGGNWSIQPQHLALILPGGSAVAPDGYQLPSLPGSDAGLDTSGLWVRFLIDDPPSGSYTLRLTPGVWFIPEGGATEATIEFSLEDRIRGSSQG